MSAAGLLPQTHSQSSAIATNPQKRSTSSPSQDSQSTPANHSCLQIRLTSLSLSSQKTYPPFSMPHIKPGSPSFKTTITNKPSGVRCFPMTTLPSSPTQIAVPPRPTSVLPPSQEPLPTLAYQTPRPSNNHSSSRERALSFPQTQTNHPTLPLTPHLTVDQPADRQAHSALPAAKHINGVYPYLRTTTTLIT